MTEVTQNGMQPSDWITLGLGAAAFVGTIYSNFIASRAVRKSSQLQIAAFRKEWIERLREDLAEFHSLTHQRIILDQTNKTISSPELKKALPDVKLSPEVITKNFSTMNEGLRRCHHLKAKIVLALNLEEKPHAELVEKMSWLLGGPYSHGINQDDLDKLIDLSRQVMKTEWDKLKSELNQN